MLTITPTIKIIATILAKNEEDIIGKVIEHHINQGVQQFIVTDNDSSDRTKEIVSKYSEVVELLDEKGDTHHQSVWVSRMAQIACKYNPDWVIHLDADEFWTEIQSLRRVQAPVAACEGMYLHPPTQANFSLTNQRWYVDLDNLPIPQETKVAHRPDPNITITHGNHAVENAQNVEVIKSIHRHHYPIRSYQQWCNKSKKHLHLKKRNAICKRWEDWYQKLQDGKLEQEYNILTTCWSNLIQKKGSQEDFLKLLSFWCTPEMLEYFKENETTPKIGEWPCETK